MAPFATPSAARARAPRRLAIPTLTGIGTAVPHRRGQAELWDGFFGEHFEDRTIAKRIWHNAGVETRHGVADPFVTDVRAWGTERRMQQFMEDGLPLGVEAVEACLADAGLDRDDVGLLSVVTCTGYGTPGVDILLQRELGLSDRVQRLHVGHMGCYAAVPGLAAVADATAARGKAAVMLCLELTSLHLQPRTSAGVRPSGASSSSTTPATWRSSTLGTRGDSAMRKPWSVTSQRIFCAWSMSVRATTSTTSKPAPNPAPSPP